jgi:ubiquinone/menaquinone biosynthesis C-methylase UbiE
MTETATADQYAAWNGESGARWVADADGRDEVLASVGTELLRTAQPRPGEDVLDIGCGCGATSIEAARLVAPAGTVLGLDLSAPMLAVARERSAALGRGNVRFEQADAQVHDAGTEMFDLAISRFGTMFFDDAQAAFSNVASSLRANGRICIVTWQPLIANEWLTVPGAPLLRYGSLPEQGDGPGMFSQSDPGALADTLQRAGFSAIDVVPASVRLRLGTRPDDAADYLANTGVGRRVLETISEASRADAIDEVRAVLSSHADPTGVHLGGAIWITTAISP